MEMPAHSSLETRWIAAIQEGLDAAFAGRDDVFVGRALPWYPVAGNPDNHAAPDIMVAVGRPKGPRSAYNQWEEGGPPQVVFEVITADNHLAEVLALLGFLEQNGAEEYYLYDPDHNALDGWRREGGSLRDITQLDGWVSPRLGIRFDLSGPSLRILGPDGRPFPTPEATPP